MSFSSITRIAAAAIAATAALTMVPAGAGKAKVTTVTKSYLPPNDLYGFCEVEPAVPGVVDQTWGENIGAVCVRIPNKVEDVRIRSITDSASDAIDFSWYFLDAEWAEVGAPSLTGDPEGYLLEGGNNHGFGCAHRGDSKAATPWFEKPRGAKYFYVFVHGLVLGAGFNAGGIGECSPETAIATVGDVKIQFRDR